MPRRLPQPVGIAALAGYVACVLAANWAIDRFGFVPVGFGLEAPAGVYLAGATFTLRDLTQDALGRSWVLIAILVGAVLSAAISPRFALASGIAFGVSELVDLAVYTPLRERGLLRAVAASNAVGLVADSALFLWLAFGSLDLLAGHVLGKVWMTMVAIALLALLRPWRLAVARSSA